MADKVALDKLVDINPAVLGREFIIVDVIPATTLLASVVALLMSGAPAHAPASKTFTKNFQTFDGGRLGLLVAAAIVLGYLLGPLSGPTRWLLEGGWSRHRVLRPVAVVAIARHRRRKERAGIRKTHEQTPDRVQRARWAQIHNREYPWLDLDLAPTRYGNTRRSLADRVAMLFETDDGHGDANDRFRDRLLALKEAKHPLAALIEDSGIRREAAERFALVWFLSGLCAVGLLSQHTWWLLLATVPFCLSWLAYTGAVHENIVYSHLVDDLARLPSQELEPPSGGDAVLKHT